MTILPIILSITLNSYCAWQPLQENDLYPFQKDLKIKIEERVVLQFLQFFIFLILFILFNKFEAKVLSFVYERKIESQKQKLLIMFNWKTTFRFSTLAQYFAILLLLQVLFTSSLFNSSTFASFCFSISIFFYSFRLLILML